MSSTPILLTLLYLSTSYFIYLFFFLSVSLVVHVGVTFRVHRRAYVHHAPEHCSAIGVTYRGCVVRAYTNLTRRTRNRSLLSLVPGDTRRSLQFHGLSSGLFSPFFRLLSARPSCRERANWIKRVVRMRALEGFRKMLSPTSGSRKRRQRTIQPSPKIAGKLAKSGRASRFEW